MRSGLDELERREPGVKLAAIGFCFGGGMTWQLLAAGEPRLSAAVPFYGPLRDDADFSGSPSAAVLGVYAELDDRVNASRDAAGAALDDAGLGHELLTVEGVDHAFFNDTGPRYDADAALPRTPPCWSGSIAIWRPWLTACGVSTRRASCDPNRRCRCVPIPGTGR